MSNEGLIYKRLTLEAKFLKAGDFLLTSPPAFVEIKKVLVIDGEMIVRLGGPEPLVLHPEEMVSIFQPVRIVQ